MKRTGKIAAVALCWYLTAVHQPAGAVGAEALFQEPAYLKELVEKAYDDNQELKQLAAEIEALKAEATAAGALDDPRITLGINALPTDSFQFDREPMTQKQISLVQRFPWFGKLDLLTRKVVIEATRKEEMLKAKQLALKRSLSEAYFDLMFAEDSLSINAELNRMITRMLRVAETAYASGRGLQQDVFQAQVELGKLMDERQTLISRRRSLVDQINELINHDTFMTIEPVKERETVLPKLSLSSRELLEAAYQNNPLLAALEVDLIRSEVEIELARKAYWPDMDFSIGYGQRDDTPLGQDRADFISGAVSFTVPIWFKQKQDRRLAAAQHRRQAAQRAYANYRNQLPHKVDAILSEIHSIEENYRLFQEALLLQTDQWARASLSAYEVGKVDFGTMINAYVRRLTFELQAERYRYAVYKNLSRLEELTALGMEELPENSKAAQFRKHPAEEKILLQDQVEGNL